ncbi:Reticulocyte-binding protein 2-like protein a [Frankliniella fusca]|uniref:Reticulocyte-binding protein 2-like protein a n=1 Tax=Frankliniella fusca TaxID=407009 RepID=A0AAE1HH18_9NEOP|nr:Reticulocyte-binding protein 2-like protein a [Frankliniella fusca]
MNQKRKSRSRSRSKNKKRSRSRASRDENHKSTSCERQDDEQQRRESEPEQEKWQKEEINLPEWEHEVQKWRELQMVCILHEAGWYVSLSVACQDRLGALHSMSYPWGSPCLSPPHPLSGCVCAREMTAADPRREEQVR